MSRAEYKNCPFNGIRFTFHSQTTISQKNRNLLSSLSTFLTYRIYNGFVQVRLKDAAFSAMRDIQVYYMKDVYTFVIWYYAGRWRPNPPQLLASFLRLPKKFNFPNQLRLEC
ncbi:hypothetical protein [Ancylothrix sp. D3o]|uniref:hypothetical protein n=1 Tax=Ancylothrix sp. D3o TaxID=2953691 RepID=UPI0021BA8A7E|nr:hypothetical protein [Ancylothrix sp. D3o]